MSELRTEIQPVKDAGSCNYCKGKVNAEGNGLDFSYDHVIVVRGNGCSTNFCASCAHTLQGQLIKDLAVYSHNALKGSIKHMKEREEQK